MPGGSLEATTGPWAQAEMQVPGPCSQEAKSEGLCAWGCRRPPQRLARVPGNPHPTAAGPSPQSGAPRVPQHSLVHWSCDPVLGLYLCAGDPGNQAQGVLTGHTNPTETQGGDGGQGGHLGGGGSGAKLWRQDRVRHSPPQAQWVLSLRPGGGWGWSQCGGLQARQLACETGHRKRWGRAYPHLPTRRTPNLTPEPLSFSAPQ